MIILKPDEFLRTGHLHFQPLKVKNTAFIYLKLKTPQRNKPVLLKKFTKSNKQLLKTEQFVLQATTDAYKKRHASAFFRNAI